jgi:hypothetical protein
VLILRDWSSEELGVGGLIVMEVDSRISEMLGAREAKSIQAKSLATPVEERFESRLKYDLCCGESELHRKGEMV